MTPPLFAIMGPTASGKSHLALKLCLQYGGEIVTVDSAQVFRGLDIGTAKPTTEEQAQVRHHLIDVIEPDAQWSAADFASHADAAIADIRKRGKVPILCGGTGLWMRALVRGIFSAPDIDPVIRRDVREELETRGAEAMHAELKAVDPKAAERIQSRDPQRIGRALEVYRQTGVPISVLQAEHGFKERRYRLVGVALDWPRATLVERIHQRTEAMYQTGLIEEAKACLDRGIGPEAPGLGIIGYRDAVQLINGQVDRAEAIRSTQVATRRYAKRQRNWFNHEPDIAWISPETPPEAVWAQLHTRASSG